MSIVIDASIMAAQLLRDEEHSNLARMIMDQLDDEGNYSPPRSSLLPPVIPAQAGIQ